MLDPATLLWLREKLPALLEPLIDALIEKRVKRLPAPKPQTIYVGGGGGGSGGGVTDHGALTGLGDDDHPQYLQPAGDYRLWIETASIAAFAAHAFSPRCSYLGAGLYAMIHAQSYSALFFAHYQGVDNSFGFESILKGANVNYSDQMTINRLSVFMDSAYRINVVNGFSAAVRVSLLSASALP